MRNTFGSVCIALGAVVLDTPDRSGCYVAKDLVGGWAYLITDREGDYRFQGAGSCPGGIDAALRWALLAALAQVPDSRQITLLVENRQVHRRMVRLAQSDGLAITGIEGRPVGVLTRPEERSVRRATNAAEQAAAVMLRDNERSDARQEAVAENAALSEGALDLRAWRVTRSYAEAPSQPPARALVTRPATPPARQFGPIMAPILHRMRKHLARLRRRPQGNAVIAAWMNDLDRQVATVRSGLEGLGT